MSFIESMFSAGFIQKPSRGTSSSKEITEFHTRKQCGKILEDSRRLSTEADPVKGRDGGLEGG